MFCIVNAVTVHFVKFNVLLVFLNPKLVKMSEIFKLKTKGDNINKIVYKEFSYTIQHKQRNNLRWKCSMKMKCKCDAVLCTSNDISNPKLIKQHNHASDKNILEVEQFKCNIKNHAKLSYDKPKQILAEAVSGLPDEILMNIPNENSVKRVIQKQRSNLNSPKPACLEDLKIEGDWSLYEEKQFLLSDMDLNHERVIIFAVDEGLRILAEVLTANIGILLDLYSVEKGLEHYRSTSTLNFQHYKYYLLREVFLSLPNILSLPVLQGFESNIDETCWLICKKDFISKCQVLPEDCMYKLFRVFCFLSELIVDPERPNRFQVIMDTSEVGLVASQIVTSLGADWDQSGFEELIGNANGFQFGTFLTLLEERYLADVDRAGLVEALNAVTNTFIDDIIKKGVLLKRGYLLPTLREYWFVLKPCQLLYYKNEEEKEQCGSITLDPRCWVDSNLQRIMLHTTERTFELATKDHRSRLQWLSALKLAISYSAGTEGYQRTLLRRRQKRRKAELQEKHRRSSIIHDMDVQLQAEKQARAAMEIHAKELKVASEKHVEELECLLEEETQAKRDEEIVRNLQARVLREEWEKREELERLQEEHILLLEQEREKRKEFEIKQREKENQLLEAQQRLIELEAEKQRLDDELTRAQKKISVSEKAVASITIVEPAETLNIKPQVKVRRTMSFIPSTKERPIHFYK